jgi:hypothetical protein
MITSCRGGGGPTRTQTCAGAGAGIIPAAKPTAKATASRSFFIKIALSRIDVIVKRV